MSPLYSFQKSAIDWLSSPIHEHLVVIAGTGTGKSRILYERAKLAGTRTLLICPLIALGRQHQRIFEQLELKTVCSIGANQSLPPNDDTQVWIVSPELIFTPYAQQLLTQWQPTFLCVDEAHCIWEWGHEFRPAYKKVPELVSLPHLEHSLWLTATLTTQHLSELALFIETKTQSPLYVQGGFEFPPGIQLTVRQAPFFERLDLMQKKILDTHSRFESGVIFVNSRKLAVKLQKNITYFTKSLNPESSEVYYYHAGLSREERFGMEQKLATSPLANKRVILIATSAFGMGMDLSYLKFAILFQPPFTLLSLAQYLGRVGRNGSKGNVDVYWDSSDFRYNQNQERLNSDLIKVQDFCKKSENEDPKLLLSEFFSHPHTTLVDSLTPRENLTLYL